jgi:hypothetical protein
MQSIIPLAQATNPASDILDNSHTACLCKYLVKSTQGIPAFMCTRLEELGKIPRSQPPLDNQPPPDNQPHGILRTQPLAFRCCGD